MATLATTSKSLTNNSSEFRAIINNNPYRFNIGLFTSDGRYQQLKLGAINKLVLVDNFTNFYHKGYVVLNNSFDAIERMIDFKNQENLTSNSNSFKPEKGFIFKGDSRDVFFVDIMPVLTEETSFDYENDKDAEEAFRLSFNFSIYNTEEIPGKSAGEKYKKLYFWDMYYELLREKNSYFSTANYLDSSDVNNLDNAERGIFTGNAVKAFLQEFFNEEDGWPITIGDKFDEGSTKVFFSAPAGYKGIDCLDYLMSRHVSDPSNQLDQAFLNIKRNSSEFNLQSIGSLFKKALDSTNNKSTSQIGDNYLETFRLGLYSDEGGFVIESVDYTPPNALFLDKYGTVNNFSYDPMPGLYTQQDLVSVLVHTYSHDERQFTIYQSQNSIQSVLSAYDSNYVKPFNSVSFKGAYPSFYPGQYRLEQKNVKNLFSVISDDPNQVVSAGRNRALFNSIFLNNTVLFKVPGSTHRTAGKFIGVNRQGSYAWSDFDSKILGVYFVVEVKHIFDGSEYFNELRCIKTYNYDNTQLTTEAR